MAARRSVLGWFLLGVTLTAVSGHARAQEAGADDLAVRAAAVHAEHCAALQGADVSAAVEGYQAVAGTWGELDEALRASDVPQPYLLYWRGLLAQCLDKREDASSDLEGFLKATEFLSAVDGEREGQLRAMAQDAARRLKRLRRMAASADVTVTVRTATPVSPKRRTGAALLIAGSLTAGAGFALNAGLYHGYYQPSTTDRTVYERASGGATAGMVVGFVGAAVAVSGVVVLVAPARAEAAVALRPGPVPLLVVRF